jgi:pimeloyl-ACP methyl ester carboxylesterase
MGMNVMMVRVCMATASALLAAPRLEARAQQLPGLDPNRNNLVYPAHYRTARTDAVGRVESIGSGPTTLVFIAGWGFSADSFRGFARQHSQLYRSLLVTLPGFGGTAGWPMPADSSSHARTPWFRHGAGAIAKLLADRGITDAVVIGHFVVGTHIALELAQYHAERVRGLVLASGELSRYWPARSDTTGRTPSTPEQRAASVDGWLVPRFFRYVTDSTWHANNYVGPVFSLDSAQGARLWAEQAAVPLPIMIRYLAQFYATDFDNRLAGIRAPVLVLKPGFNDATFALPGLPYLRSFFHDSWKPALGRAQVTMQTIPDAGVFLWLDQPRAFAAALAEFAAQLGTRKPNPF